MALIAGKALTEGAAAAAAVAIGGRRILAPCRSRDLRRGLVYALTFGRGGVRSIEIRESFLAVCRSGEAVFPWASGLRRRWIAG